MLSPEDFNNAIGGNKHRLFLTEIDDDVIILRRSDISGFFERVLRPVIEADTKRAERLPFHQTFDFLGFHAGKVTSGAASGNREMDASNRPRGMFSTGLRTRQPRAAVLSNRISGGLPG